MKVNHYLAVLIFCVSSFASTSLAAETPPAKPDAKPKLVPAPARDTTQETLKQMTQELKLTEVQQEQVNKALQSAEQAMREVRSDKSLSPQEFAAKGREVRAANDQRLREILTPEQYQKWQKILAQRGTRRRPELPPGAEVTPNTTPPQTGSGHVKEP